MYILDKCVKDNVRVEIIPESAPKYVTIKVSQNVFEGRTEVRSIQSWEVSGKTRDQIDEMVKESIRDMAFSLSQVQK